MLAGTEGGADPPRSQELAIYYHLLLRITELSRLRSTDAFHIFPSRVICPVSNHLAANEIIFDEEQVEQSPAVRPA
jgi:hypothetical protein